MKVAIVGTSHNLTESEERDIQQTIAYIINRYEPDEDTIISGGAKGVDKMAIESAISRGFNTLVFSPKKEQWDGGYKERNIKIAEECHIIYCVSIPIHNTECYHHKTPPPLKHEKTAGCWTLNRVREMGKECFLLVTPKR